MLQWISEHLAEVCICVTTLGVLSTLIVGSFKGWFKSNKDNNEIIKMMVDQHEETIKQIVLKHEETIKEITNKREDTIIKLVEVFKETK